MVCLIKSRSVRIEVIDPRFYCPEHPFSYKASQATPPNTSRWHRKVSPRFLQSQSLDMQPLGSFEPRVFLSDFVIRCFFSFRGLLRTGLSPSFVASCFVLPPFLLFPFGLTLHSQYTPLSGTSFSTWVKPSPLDSRVKKPLLLWSRGRRFHGRLCLLSL